VPKAVPGVPYQSNDHRRWNALGTTRTQECASECRIAKILGESNSPIPAA
jgi:hypothetical protein